jgi:hypothetical protein
MALWRVDREGKGEEGAGGLAAMKISILKYNHPSLHRDTMMTRHLLCLNKELFVVLINNE